MPSKIPKFKNPWGPLAPKYVSGYSIQWPIADFNQMAHLDTYKLITPKGSNLLSTSLNTNKLETNKLLPITQGSSSVDPAKLTSGFNIGSAGLDLIGSIAKPLDHVSGASTALDVGSKIAGAIPGPLSQGISAVLKATKLIDQLTGKKANTQITQGETAKGYNLDFNANANTSYGGLFGNKKRREANKLSSSQDISNIKKLDVSKTAEKELLAAQNTSQTILNKNNQRLLGGTSTNILSAKKGDKLIFTRIANKFQNGGQVNVIPSGALHRELNHLEGDHTKKGIPVITEESGGKITQQAEVERDEIIFNLDLTKKLEELLKKHNKGDELAAIEAGKLLTEEILENTEDNTGLLNKIV